MFHFAFDAVDSFGSLIAPRSRYRIDRDPYPGNHIKIRQDFRPSARITECWDAPCLGASSDLRSGWGLAVPDVAQEGDPLSGSDRLRM